MLVLSLRCSSNRKNSYKDVTQPIYHQFSNLPPIVDVTSEEEVFPIDKEDEREKRIQTSFPMKMKNKITEQYTCLKNTTFPK